MMRTGFHPGTLDLLALSYEPVATIPGLVVARYRTRPDSASRHWHSLSARSPHRCGPAGALAERSEFLMMTAMSKASYWCHVGQWRAPNISLPVNADELCEHSALPRLLARAMASSTVRARHLTLELDTRPDVPLAVIEKSLRRLHDLGLRVSYAPATAAPEFDEFPFDEARVGYSTAVPAASDPSGRRRSILATGVTTGDHLMAALSIGADHVDGSFAGTVRSDRMIVRGPSRVDDLLACI